MPRSLRFTAALSVACAVGCGVYEIGSIVSTDDGGGASTSMVDPSSSSTTGSELDSSSSGPVDDCEPCPSLLAGATDLGRDPRIDGYFRAVEDLRLNVDIASQAYSERLLAVAQAWGYGGDVSPTPAAIAGLLAHIDVEIAASTASGVVFLVGRLFCRADVGLAVTEQVRCETELGCPLDPTCAATLGPGSLPIACDGVCVGACEGGCVGLAMCSPQPAPGIACGLACYGDCQLDEQVCPGKCIGVCDGTPDFEGSCLGACTGTCALTQGGTCYGQCLGYCQDDATALGACPPALLACVGGCAGPCDGACLGPPRLSASQACGGGLCSAAVDCVTGLRAMLDPMCEEIVVEPCWQASASLGPDEVAAFASRVDALRIQLPFILDAHARLTFVRDGTFLDYRALVNPAITPSPADRLSQKLAELWGLSGSLEVPCAECAVAGLNDALAITGATLEQANALVEAGDVLRGWLE